MNGDTGRFGFSKLVHGAALDTELKMVSLAKVRAVRWWAVVLSGEDEQSLMKQLQIIEKDI